MAAQQTVESTAAEATIQTAATDRADHVSAAVTDHADRSVRRSEKQRLLI